MNKTHKDLIREFFSAYNDSNLDETLDFIHPNIQYYPPGYVKRYYAKDKFNGKQTIKELFQKNLEIAPNIKIEIEKIISEQNDHCVIGSTNFGEIVNSMFGIEAGQTVETFESIVLITIQDDLIYKFKWIYDTLDVFTKVGATVYNQDDQEIIDRYIGNLREIGLIE